MNKYLSLIYSAAFLVFHFIAHPISQSNNADNTADCRKAGASTQDDFVKLVAKFTTTPIAKDRRDLAKKISSLQPVMDRTVFVNMLSDSDGEIVYLGIAGLDAHDYRDSDLLLMAPLLKSNLFRSKPISVDMVDSVPVACDVGEIAILHGFGESELVPLIFEQYLLNSSLLSDKIDSYHRTRIKETIALALAIHCSNATAIDFVKKRLNTEGEREELLYLCFYIKSPCANESAKEILDELRALSNGKLSDTEDGKLASDALDYIFRDKH